MEASTNEELTLSSRLSGKLPELKSIVSLLTCSICYGSVREPLSASVEGCGHTFCSLCVRGYLAKFKQQCPQCLKELHDRDLLLNRPLKAITQYVYTLLPKLEAWLKESLNEHINVSKPETSHILTRQINDHVVSSGAGPSK
jgi:E3 ubiquitin-protein ligase RAD18